MQLPETVEELRQFLSQKLPDYMVPSAFVMLEALPLSANGKVRPQSSSRTGCSLPSENLCRA
jgi:acyl-CoA synthetase (AMP-forming)/AMP-acid ligase II